jgi:ferredoxin-NADP reductase
MFAITENKDTFTKHCKQQKHTAQCYLPHKERKVFTCSRKEVIRQMERDVNGNGLHETRCHYRKYAAKRSDFYFI